MYDHVDASVSGQQINVHQTGLLGVVIAGNFEDKEDHHNNGL
jgi:hypothetical protein